MSRTFTENGVRGGRVGVAMDIHFFLGHFILAAFIKGPCESVAL